MIADNNMDLLKARNLTDALTGRQEFSAGHISKVTEHLKRQSSTIQALLNEQHGGQDASRSWANEHALFTTGAGWPDTMVDMMNNIFEQDADTLNELRNMLSTGVQWHDFQHETTMRAAVEGPMVRR